MKRAAQWLGFFAAATVARKLLHSRLVRAITYVFLSDWLLLNKPKKARR